MDKNFKYSPEYCDTVAYKERIKLNELGKSLFNPIIEKLIESNNEKKINEFLDYLKGKIWISSTQFLYSHLYIISGKNPIVKDVVIDFTLLDKKIDEFNKQYQYVNVLEKEYE